jgi:hypothetical protein
VLHEKSTEIQFREPAETPQVESNAEYAAAVESGKFSRDGYLRPSEGPNCGKYRICRRAEKAPVTIATKTRVALFEVFERRRASLLSH